MSLVAYSSSSSSDDGEDEEEPASTPPPAKKRRVSSSAPNGRQQKKNTADLPQLPARFMDQYSSTVRTSVQDDPSLHSGRKRVTPHVQGNWPAHVYLEWHPSPEETELLSQLINATTAIAATNQPTKTSANEIHSLLHNDLSVPLPLHISLSRPLTLKTAQKDPFLNRLKEQVVQESGIRSFTVRPKGLAWHGNESGTRWFLVVRLESVTAATTTEHGCGSPRRNSEMGRGKGMEVLGRLLKECNHVAKDFGQEVLYARATNTATSGRSGGGGGGSCGPADDGGNEQDQFHISIAWSLNPPASASASTKGNRDDLGSATGVFSTRKDGKGEYGGSGIPYELLARLTEVSIEFDEMKVRIGQDVHRLPLRARRQST